jgi:hypothetical protein
MGPPPPTMMQYSSSSDNQQHQDVRHLSRQRPIDPVFGSAQTQGQFPAMMAPHNNYYHSPVASPNANKVHVFIPTPKSNTTPTAKQEEGDKMAQEDLPEIPLLDQQQQQPETSAAARTTEEEQKDDDGELTDDDIMAAFDFGDEDEVNEEQGEDMVQEEEAQQAPPPSNSNDYYYSNDYQQQQEDSNNNMHNEATSDYQNQFDQQQQQQYDYYGNYTSATTAEDYAQDYPTTSATEGYYSNYDQEGEYNHNNDEAYEYAYPTTDTHQDGGSSNSYVDNANYAYNDYYSQPAEAPEDPRTTYDYPTQEEQQQQPEQYDDYYYGGQTVNNEAVEPDNENTYGYVGDQEHEQDQQFQQDYNNASNESSQYYDTTLDDQRHHQEEPTTTYDEYQQNQDYSGSNNDTATYQQDNQYVGYDGYYNQESTEATHQYDDYPQTDDQWVTEEQGDVQQPMEDYYEQNDFDPTSEDVDNNNYPGEYPPASEDDGFEHVDIPPYEPEESSSELHQDYVQVEEEDIPGDEVHEEEAPSRKPHFDFLSDQQSIQAELQRAQEMTLRRRRNFLERMENIEMDLCKITAQYGDESMDFNLAIRDTIDRVMTRPLEAATERFVMDRDSCDVRRTAIRNLERRLDNLDSRMTRHIHVTLGDSKRDELDTLQDQISHDLRPSMRVLTSKSNKIEGGIVRRYEELVEMMSYKYSQESAARLASLSLLNDKASTFASQDEIQLDDFLDTIRTLRIRLQEERAARKAADQKILNDVVKTTTAMKRALLDSVVGST